MTQKLPSESNSPQPGAGGPLLLLLGSAAVWLVVASGFALIASIKFHSPKFLGDVSWLTYGRVRPAYLTLLVYGFCLQAGIAVALGLIARLGAVRLVWPSVAAAGSLFWNLGVAVGVLAILCGGSTGFELLEMPRYAAVLVFAGWTLIGLCALLTLHYRRERRLHPSLWFVIAAVFWFPWIYTTANLLLLVYPVRGIAQVVIGWWFAQNLTEVCFGMLGLSVIFYFVPKIAGRELHSRHLALLAFWVLVLVTGWGGIPNSAPVPAWMPAASTVASVMGIVLILSVILNACQTLGRVMILGPKDPALSFVLIALGSFTIAGLLQIGGALLDGSRLLGFTWFSQARFHLQVVGFLVLALLGAAYFLLPRAAGSSFPWPGLVRVHLWLALVGCVLVALPLAVGGLVQVSQLQDANVEFPRIVRTSAHFLRVSTIGDLCLLVGHGLFLLNVAGLARRVCQGRVARVLEAATADLFKPAGGRA
jgi:cytochrome c oxidase cbb3-type subunit 1